MRLAVERDEDQLRAIWIAELFPLQLENTKTAFKTKEKLKSQRLITNFTHSIVIERRQTLERSSRFELVKEDYLEAFWKKLNEKL